MPPKMANSKKQTPPTLLAILCILGFIGALTSPLTLHKEPWTTILGAWFWPYLVFHGALLLAALAGLWRMKRWGLVLYALSIIESQLFLLAAGYWSVVSLVFFAAIFSIPLYYRRAMS